MRGTSRLDRIERLPFTRVLGDVRDVRSFRDEMLGCDCTMHLAAPDAWEQDDPAQQRQVVEEGTRHILAVASERRGHRVVVVSSTAAIAASSHPVVFDERTPFSMPDPSLHYAVTNHGAGRVTHDAFERGVPVIVVNPAEVSGCPDILCGNFVHRVPTAWSRGGN